MPIHHYYKKGGGKPQVPTTFAMFGHLATKKNECGGKLKPGKWVTRKLPVVIYNDIEGSYIEKGNLYVPPGAYHIIASACACGTGQTRIRIGRPNEKDDNSTIVEGDSVNVDSKHKLNYWMHAKGILIVPRGTEDIIAVQTMTELSSGEFDGGDAKGVEKYKFVYLELTKHYRE